MLISMRTLLILVLTALAAFGQATAPAWDRLRQSVRIGDRVRVESATGAVSGELVDLTAEKLVVSRSGSRSDFQAAEITRVYWMLGRLHGAGKWTLIGHGVGAASGVIAAVVVTRNDQAGETLLAALLLGGLAAAAGAVIGFVASVTTTHKKLVYQRP